MYAHLRRFLLLNPALLLALLLCLLLAGREVADIDHEVLLAAGGGRGIALRVLLIGAGGDRVGSSTGG